MSSAIISCDNGEIKCVETTRMRHEICSSSELIWRIHATTKNSTKKQNRHVVHGTHVFFPSFSCHPSTAVQLLDKQWSQVSSLLPLGPCLPFLSRIGFSNSTHCPSIFSSSVANSRSRAFGKSICARAKVPTDLYQ